MSNLKKILQSKVFKKIVFAISVILFLVSFISLIKPGPLLKLDYPGIFLAHLLGGGALLTIGMAKYFNPYLFAILTALGMALNDSLSYLVGRNSEVFIGRPEKAKRVEGIITKYGFWGLFVWSLIPFPYDLIGFVVGYLRMPYSKFFLASFLGKFIRTLLLALGIISITN